MAHGFLIAADLENASGLDRTTLGKGVECIRGWYNQFWDKRSDVLFSPFIDGALIALPSPIDERMESKTVYRYLIESCENWIQSMAEIDSHLSLRVAIHKGDFFPIQEKLPAQVIVGTDALHCSRLVRLASGGQVIISEEFRDSWRAFDSKCYEKFLIDQRLHPRGEQPLLFWQKPKTPSRIRYVVPPNAPHKPSSAEKRAALAIQTTMRLMRELQFDLAFFLQAEKEVLLRESGRDYENVTEPEKRFFGRISIFRPDPKNPNHLACWLRLDRDANLEVEGNLNPKDFSDLMDMEYPRATTYSYDPPNGPVGFAFKEGKWKSQRTLPKWEGKDGKKKYREMMEKWGFTPEMTDKMNHHSRAFFAIPFSEHDITDYENMGGIDPQTVEPVVKSDDPTGVICVDWDDPLKMLRDNEVLEEFFEEYKLYRFSLFATCAMRDGS